MQASKGRHLFRFDGADLHKAAHTEYDSPKGCDVAGFRRENETGQVCKVSSIKLWSIQSCVVIVCHSMTQSIQYRHTEIVLLLLDNLQGEGSPH